MKRIAILILIAAAVVVIALKDRDEEVIRLQGRAMGSSWSLSYSGKASDELRGSVAEELERWEQVMSQWRKDSDLCRYNRGEEASADLKRVIELAERIKKESGGAFDFVVLEQVHEAGFGPDGKGIDLSAIGKGFAVDRVGDRLRALGIDEFIFELGGEVLAGKGDWTCEIESPQVGGKGKVLSVQNRAVATSGNYRQFRASEDGLVSHIIDPRTGEAVVRAPCSVSVYADDCATADAWATALFVLGPEADPENAPDFAWQVSE